MNASSSSHQANKTKFARHKKESRTEYRTATQVDRDRLLYATDFARLAEITQVVSADHGYVFHNRLTHSLKVAQLSRRIAEKLISEQEKEVAAVGGVDVDAAEACALAHDLGHPPFGHVVEKELNRLVRKKGDSDGFEGNAQSFRLVATLSVSDAIGSKPRHLRGLNLTRQTLNGILKYPWFYGENGTEKWGSYETERELFNWVRKDFKFGKQIKSLEAEIMDWSDDITYAVHDVVDFYCAGKIPLELLRSSGDTAMKERHAFLEGVFVRKKIVDRQQQIKYEKAFWDVLQWFPIDRRYDGTFEQRWEIWQFITTLITMYVNAFHIVDKPKKGSSVVGFEGTVKDEVFMLKQLTWHYVIENTDLATYQRGQVHMVREIFEILLDCAKKPKLRLFPPAYEAMIVRAKENKGSLIRAVTDYVSGMTEKEVHAVHAKFHRAQ